MARNIAKNQESDSNVLLEKCVEENAYTIGTQTYIWGIGPYISYSTRFTELYGDNKNLLAPAGVFFGLNELGNVDNTYNVMPNNNTLYARAWAFIGNEPLILSIPNMNLSIYYSVALIDFYQNTFKIFGTNTIGQKGGNFAITGPKWHGDLPSCLNGSVVAPTPWIWLLQRIAPKSICDEDVKPLEALQKGILLTPLSQWGNPNYTPPSRYENPKGQMDPDFSSDPLHFFELVSEIINENPPPRDQKQDGLMALFSQIGISPGMKFDRAEFDSAVHRGLLRAVDTGSKIIESATYHAPTILNGWTVPPKEMGNYDSKYLDRAVYATRATGALPKDEVVYVTAFEDSEGNPLNGTNKYILNLPKTIYSQHNAFWSLTLYNADMMFVPNSINRYQVGSQVPGLKYNEDESIDIYLQSITPQTGKESNWLPAPKNSFNVTFRWYLPKKPVLGIYEGIFKLPPIQKID